eukprot:Clim_evm2s43 gene=Clim_evmTU2s43
MIGRIAVLRTLVRQATPAVTPLAFVRAIATDKPRMITVKVSGESDQMKTTMNEERAVHTMITDEPERLGGTDQGPTPLQMALSSLAGCETATLYGICKRANIKIDHISYKVEGAFDARGTSGVAGVSPAFQTVQVNAKIVSDGEEDKVRECITLAGKRCPIYALFVQAGVDMRSDWEVVKA